jgi:hypothetical protein
MLPKDDTAVLASEARSSSADNHHNTGPKSHYPDKRHHFRQRCHGALIVNLATFRLPALYATLSKLWVASFGASIVVATNSYT